MKTAKEKIYDKYNPVIIEVFLSFAEAYHQEKLKNMCTCGGYPECICDITKTKDTITDVDLRDIDQAKDDYYKRDKLFERK